MPSSRRVRESAALGLIVEVNQGLVLRKYHQVDPSIVVQVSRGQAASQERDLEGRSGTIGHVDQLAPPFHAGEKLRPHLLRNIGADYRRHGRWPSPDRAGRRC